LYTPAVVSIKRLYPVSDAVTAIGFTDKQTAQFHNQVRRDLGPRLKATDVSGWDRTLGPGWVLEAAESVIRSAADKAYPSWTSAVRNHVYGLINPAFIVPCEDQYAIVTRRYPGGMLSGSFMTTTFNTLARLDVSNAAGSIRAKAAGDDCLELFPEDGQYDYVAAYAKLGFTIRASQTQDDGRFEFCSHLYDDRSPDKAQLTSEQKLVLRYFQLPKVTFEHYGAALYELRHNPNLEKLKPYLKQRFVEHFKPDQGAGLEQNDQQTQHHDQC
jgi:hypothetical protein